MGLDLCFDSDVLYKGRLDTRTWSAVVEQKFGPKLPTAIDGPPSFLHWGANQG